MRIVAFCLLVLSLMLLAASTRYPAVDSDLSWLRDEARVRSEVPRAYVAHLRGSVASQGTSDAESTTSR